MSVDRLGPLGSVYRDRIREPRTTDEVYGYWLFVLGVLLGIVGLIVAFGSEVASTRRGLGIVLMGVALLALLLGSVIRLELQSRANQIAIVGAIIGLVAIAWFWVAYPSNWQFGTQQVWNVIGLGGVGIALMIVAAVVIPLVTDPQAAVAAEADAARATAEADAGAVRAELSDTIAALAALGESQSQFELYTDRGGDHRWRLRHRNGNVIADSGEGYASRQKAGQGIRSVKRDAYGAAVVDLPDLGLDIDAADEATTDPPVVTDAESQATFELYEDVRGEHRWRLRHDNGEIIADSGEGYASRSGLTTAVERLRAYVPTADYLRVDPAAFEVYQDTAGEWRWRLIVENGNIIADSGEGYSGRTRCREGAESVARNVGVDGDASFEIYEDRGGDYRWRLRHDNGEIIADSGEGYSAESAAEDAVERIREYAPDADLLDVGESAFEIFVDQADEWRWHLRHRNGNVLADSGQGYGTRGDATAAVTRAKRHAPNAAEERLAE